MSDVGTGVFAKVRVVPEDVVALSVFSLACFGWFVLQEGEGDKSMNWLELRKSTHYRS